MPVKRVVVLANSIKKGHRCIAGRELLARGELGSWVRPVRPANENNGALRWSDIRVSDGNFAAVGDIVEIPVHRQTGDPGQPENWLLDTSVAWNKVEVYPATNFAGLAEDISDLWDDGSRSDRISVEAQQAREPQRSLVMIKPLNLRVACYREQKPWHQYPRKQTIARFEYAGVTYNLNITDDRIKGHHGEFPALDAPELVYTPHFGDNCLLCVSLTPPFDNAHWKVVATILPLP